MIDPGAGTVAYVRGGGGAPGGQFAVRYDFAGQLSTCASMNQGEL